MRGNVYTHFVEYLGMQAATVVHPGPGVKVNENEPVVVITVRPEPTSFRSHNFGLSLAQAQRLSEDLLSLLETYSCLGVLLLALMAVGFGGGCSARYEAREEKLADSRSGREIATEKSAMAFQVARPRPRTLMPPSREPNPSHRRVR